MKYTKEELRRILKEIGCNGRADVKCTQCGKLSNKRARYLRESINKSDDGFCEIFCSQQCHIESRIPFIYTHAKCGTCGKEMFVLKSRIQDSISGLVFCSSSCAATHNNSNRIRSEESKLKVSKSLKEFYGNVSPDTLIRNKEDKVCENCGNVFRTSIQNKIFCSEECRVEKRAAKRLALNRSRSTKPGNYNNFVCSVEFSYCPICNKPFISKAKRILRKYCSKTCSLKAASIRQSAWLSKAENRGNLGRHKKSYPEEMFIKWLDINNVSYRFEPKFENTDEGKYYFPDFVFDEIKLIIELDGTQHRNTLEKDRIRDEYITSKYGYTVKRFWCKDFLKGIHYNEICSLLGVVVDLSKQQ